MRQKQNSHQQQPKQKLKAQTVWGVYAKSTHPVMHMPCKKAKAPPRSECVQPRDKGRKNKDKAVRLWAARTPGEGAESPGAEC